MEAKEANSTTASRRPESEFGVTGALGRRRWGAKVEGGTDQRQHGEKDDDDADDPSLSKASCGLRARI